MTSSSTTDTDYGDVSFSLLDLNGDEGDVVDDDDDANDEDDDIEDDYDREMFNQQSTDLTQTVSPKSSTDLIVNQPTSSTEGVSSKTYNGNKSGITTTTDRRVAKQITERRRRDRIKALLDDLRILILKLLHKNPRHHRKLERVDVLELVVSFLKRELKNSNRKSINPTTALPSNQELNQTIGAAAAAEINPICNPCLYQDIHKSSLLFHPTNPLPTRTEIAKNYSSITTCPSEVSGYLKRSANSDISFTNADLSMQYPRSYQTNHPQQQQQQSQPYSDVYTTRRPFANLANIDRIPSLVDYNSCSPWKEVIPYSLQHQQHTLHPPSVPLHHIHQNSELIPQCYNYPPNLIHTLSSNMPKPSDKHPLGQSNNSYRTGDSENLKPAKLIINQDKPQNHQLSLQSFICLSTSASANSPLWRPYV